MFLCPCSYLRATLVGLTQLDAIREESFVSCRSCTIVQLQTNETFDNGVRRLCMSYQVYMNLAEYEKLALSTSLHINEGNRLICSMLGLVGEAGEAADKLKKIIRESEHASGWKITEEEKKALVSEVGDVLWYVAVLSHELGSSLEEVAAMNIEKLKSRKLRGVIHGAGDNR